MIPVPVVNVQFRRDPSRTSTLRLNFMRDMDRRWNAIKRDMRVSIIDRDCFGIQPENQGFLFLASDNGIVSLAATAPKQFAFESTDAKVRGFMQWLNAQEEAGLLELVDQPGFFTSGKQPWTNKYIDSAYQQGIRRGRAELIKIGEPVASFEAIPGGVSAVMNGPIHADTVATLYSRTFEDLVHVKNAANAAIRREITDALTSGLSRGLAEGKSPLTIARELYNDAATQLDKIGITRARIIARTEIIRAHHLANINEYDAISGMLDQEGLMVDIIAEWGLGPNPCPICIDLEADAPYTLDEVRSLIPAHPRCVCVAIPKTRRRPQPQRRMGSTRFTDILSPLTNRQIILDTAPAMT